MTTPRDRDPLAPIETVVKVLLTFLLVILALIGGTMAWQLATTGTTEVGFGSFGGGEVCLTDVHDVPVTDDPVGGEDGGGRTVGGFDLSRGYYVARTWDVCTDSSTLGQRVVVGLGDAASILGIVGSMALLLWAVRGARRAGLFTPTAARRTRVLGWFLLAVALVVPVLTSVGQGLVLSSLIEGYPWWRPLGGVTFSRAFSALTIVVSIGIITFARILERAVPLQEEVDATV